MAAPQHRPSLVHSGPVAVLHRLALRSPSSVGRRRCWIRRQRRKAANSAGVATTWPKAAVSATNGAEGSAAERHTPRQRAACPPPHFKRLAAAAAPAVNWKVTPGAIVVVEAAAGCVRNCLLYVVRQKAHGAGVLRPAPGPWRRACSAAEA